MSPLPTQAYPYIQYQGPLTTLIVKRIPDEISFHCPLALTKDSSIRKLPKTFSTVSGLAQYIESSAGYGGKETLRRAVEYL